MNIKYDLGKMRNKLGVSQEWLAEKMSVSRQTISKWENGDALPSTKHLLMLMEIFDFKAEDLEARPKKEYISLIAFSSVAFLALAVSFGINFQKWMTTVPCTEVRCCEETGVCMIECHFNKTECLVEKDTI